MSYGELEIDESTQKHFQDFVNQLGDVVVTALNSAWVSVALNEINKHRTKIGQNKLDPSYSGWSDDDVLHEFERLFGCSVQKYFGEEGQEDG